MSKIELQEKFHFITTEKGLHVQLNTVDEGIVNGTLTVDFLSGTQNYRRLHGGGIKQPLAKAVGIKPGVRPSIIDVTAGLGNDAFCLACLGCQVTMIERSPILARLLEDGLARAARNPEIQEIVINKLSLIHGESCNILENLTIQPDTIYLDPMYPHKQKSALNKQEMRIIRTIVGDDLDANKLLQTCLLHAGKRVVVKRPKGAERINNLPPSHIITMKNSRYDIYMITG